MMAVEFSPQAEKEFEETLERYPNKEAVLLPVLHLAQREFGVLSDEVLEYVARLLVLPPSRVKSVASFYTLFNIKEVGRYVIRVCHTLPCALNGAEEVMEYIKKRLNIEVGETTPDKKFTLLECECLGSCNTAPVMQINDRHYENLSLEKIDQILGSLE